jgi:putative hemolysin
MQPIVDTAEVAPPRQLSTRRSSGNPFLLRDKGLELRLASSRFERMEAQRLRFEVFNLELRLGLTSSQSSGLDQDAHDGHCDHLLVVDTECDCLVGTYRLLSFDRVPSFGFYSESEFDLSNVKRSGLRLLELGRSCVALEYRDGRAISLLFRGYLRLGAKVCGPPAYDRQFGTTDFFVLAKTRDIVGRYSRRFLG